MSDMVIGEALKQFIRSRIAANRRASTLRQYNRAVQHYASWTGFVYLAQVTVQSVRDYLAAHASDWRPATRATNRDLLCIFFGWCASEELMPEVNWSKRVPKVVMDQGAPKTLTPEQTKRLVVAVDTMQASSEMTRRRDVAIIYLLLDTGLRSGELTRLQLSDVDLPGRSIRVDSACKGRKERHVWFSPETEKRLRAYLRLRRSKTPWVLVSHNDRPLTGSYLLHLVKKVGYDAGVELTVHRLRHTALTMLAVNGMSPILLQKFAGHANITTTMVYARPDDRAIRMEYERVAPMNHLVS